MNAITPEKFTCEKAEAVLPGTIVRSGPSRDLNAQVDVPVSRPVWAGPDPSIALSPPPPTALSRWESGSSLRWDENFRFIARNAFGLAFVYGGQHVLLFSIDQNAPRHEPEHP